MTENVEKLMEELKNGLLDGKFIRAINYHNTHEWDKELIEDDMKFIKEHFSSVTVSDLDKFFETGKWHKEKPGLIISVFEGYRNNYDVLLPLLDKYELTGWYHIPVRFLDIPIMEQKKWAKDHIIEIFKHDEYLNDKRYALTNEELKEIAKRHVVGCHTMTHERISDELEEDYIKYEIVESKKLFEEKLGFECPFFCWLGGKDFRTNDIAKKYIEEANYKYMFSNYKLQKLR